MSQIEHTVKESARRNTSGKTVERQLPNVPVFLNRPVLMGLLSLLAILSYCQTYGTTVNPSYQLSRYSEIAFQKPASTSPELNPNPKSQSTALPLLFLSFVGLAGMALSRTGSSKNDRR
jgi:hypothetical protein